MLGMADTMPPKIRTPPLVRTCYLVAQFYSQNEERLHSIQDTLCVHCRALPSPYTVCVHTHTRIHTHIHTSLSILLTQKPQQFKEISTIKGYTLTDLSCLSLITSLVSVYTLY